MEQDRKLRFNISLPRSWIEKTKEKSNINENEDANTSDSIPASLIAINLYKNDKNVIEAFKSLYKKYIDSNYAPFMINIASHTRVQLTESLDTSYYYRQPARRRSEAFANDSSSGDSDTCKVDMCMIDKEWKEEGQGSYQWLIQRLVTEMDQAANEITKLMNDSFIRFKSKSY